MRGANFTTCSSQPSRRSPRRRSSGSASSTGSKPKSPASRLRRGLRRGRTVPWPSSTPCATGWWRSAGDCHQKNALAKAIQYALSRWEALTRYAGDGRLAIDNNVAERALRGIAVTRKNFLFLGSEAGGERAAILYTVLESAKLNGLDPQAWLSNVIHRMANGHPSSRLAELLPLELAAPDRHPRRMTASAAIG